MWLPFVGIGAPARSVCSMRCKTKNLWSKYATLCCSLRHWSWMCAPGRCKFLCPWMLCNGCCLAWLGPTTRETGGR